jgi:two-component system sensor histidine kinase YesM
MGGRIELRGSRELMRSKKYMTTVTRKYTTGYLVIAAIAALIVIASWFLSIRVIRIYQNENKKLTVLNELEQSVQELNANVYNIYVSMNSSRFDSYKELREACGENLQASESNVKDDYIREITDLNEATETYLNATDQLTSDIREYLDTYSTDKLADIQEEYKDQQQLYTFVMDDFQSSYSVRLGMLNGIQSDLSASIKKTIVGVIAGLALACAFGLLYAVYILKNISHSIHVLENGVNSFQTNIETAAPIDLTTCDEMEELANAFNRMQSIIQSQMQKIAESARDKERIAEVEKENLRIYGQLQKNNLDFLQSRINPHFLFNTLNMISAQARIEDADKTAELLETTATFLRYNLDNIQKTVTLEQEKNNLSDFIEIEKSRYGKRFQFIVNISPDTYDQSMPCMILQPLVENAVSHGVGSSISGGWIRVESAKEENRVIIKVSDSGQGMAEEEIQKLYKELQSKEILSQHIGIKNIYLRLQLFYSSDVRLTMMNLQPGFEICISVPFTPRLGAGSEKKDE